MDLFFLLQHWGWALEKESHSFIVRIWSEMNDGKSPGWRGSIDYVGSDKRLYFQELEGIIRFIKQQTGLNEGQSRRGWLAFWQRLFIKKDQG